jgi:hypothetical protein
MDLCRNHLFSYSFFSDFILITCSICRDKGVKVELGIPYELWDKPSVEITTLKTQCENLIENHESDIEDWYYSQQGKVSLTKYYFLFVLFLLFVYCISLKFLFDFQIFMLRTGFKRK